MAQRHLKRESLNCRSILEEQQVFVELLCKHFTPPVVARIQLVLCVHAEQQSKVQEGEEESIQLDRLMLMDLWHGAEQVNTLIIKAL